MRQRGLTESSAVRSLPLRYISSQCYSPVEYMVTAWRKPLGKNCPEARISAHRMYVFEELS